jgi:hypothetical protein
MTRFSDELLDALIKRDRQAQGLPPTIEDDEPFRKIAALLDSETDEPIRAKQRAAERTSAA